MKRRQSRVLPTPAIVEMTMSERSEACSSVRIEEGERIMFDEVSRTYIRVCINVLLNKEGNPTHKHILLFTKPSGESYGSFLVDGDFRLQHADAQDLVALFRTIAPT